MSGLFVFGTLLDAELRRLVLGRDAAQEAAILPGWAVERSAEGDWPILVERSGAAARGLLLSAGTAELDRAHFYESGFGYTVAAEAVETDDGRRVSALVYRAPGGSGSGADWSLPQWQENHGALTRRTARRVMDLHGRMAPEGLRRAMPMLRARVHSAMLAEADPAPRALRADLHRDRLEIRAHDTPYCDYFAVSETRLRHPLFDGDMSAEMLRAGFASGDAVTVLPYDPGRDRVLVVEQFRYGPWLRGDPYPWALEPVAGRIDPGETAETTARREAGEEAGLRIGALHEVGRYYASPGAVAEYVTSYVGLAELPDGAGGLGGLDAEHEDIRAHVIAFDRLMALTASGEVDTGPLLISALWLERERARGRFA